MQGKISVNDKMEPVEELHEIADHAHYDSQGKKAYSP
jgi:hypothetical protein